MSVEIERRDRVAIVRYMNPPLGYIANKGAAHLSATILECLEDENIRAIVLTGGSPEVFIRHADVSQIARAAKALETGQITAESFLHAPFPKLMAVLENAEKPVIAAINGLCMGGGFEIALACTMRIAGAGVRRIGLPEIRIDIFPGSGGTQRLWRLLGWQRARLFALRGEVVGANEALTLGLVDEVSNAPVERAVEVARELARRNRNAVAAILRVTRQRDIAAGLDEEIMAFADLLAKDPTVRRRLEQFVQNDERLDAID